jgi:nitrite reductase/ring-hydroxylating ferredoxin subunit
MAQDVKTLRFGGYYNRPPPDDDTLLTAVGPGTPGGEYLRRYWHPFMLVSELGELPLPVRLLGEDLVVFRDQAGRVGLLHRHCSHRGVSLEFGIIAEHGIRCCYHGWLFDIDGTVLERPGEPEPARSAAPFCHGAYKVREEHGLLFAYMGPPELEPAFPLYDTFMQEGSVAAPFKLAVPCNWVQIVENAADPIHNAFLHAIVSGQQFSPAFKVMPVLDFVPTPLGFLSMATRRIGDFVFIRAGELMLPNVAQFPAGTNAVQQESVRANPTLTRWAVPLDDHHSLYIGVTHLNDLSNPRSRRLEDYGVDKMPFIGQTADRPYEDRQREPGDYDAMIGPGPVVNRKAEHLGTSDRGVVHWRRVLGAAIKAVQAGTTPPMPRTYPDGTPVRTYAHESVMRLPSKDALAERAALDRYGKREAQVFINMDERVTQAERNAVATEQVRRVLADSCAGIPVASNG